MANLSLLNVSQTNFDTAEAMLIALVREAYPELDLRKGTVLRDLLIRPAASIYALNVDQINDLKSKLSLNTILNNPNAEASDIDAILANFGIGRGLGSKANGVVLVKVDSDRRYTIAGGFKFIAPSNLVFVTSKTYTVTKTPENLSDIKLYYSDDGYYYFILPVESEAIGLKYNIPEGTQLTPVSSLYGLISVSAYSTFSGGADEESVNDVILRLPDAITYKTLDSISSIRANLTSATLPVKIYDLNVCGYGSPVQLRDKHNPFGLSVGGKADIFVRSFNSPTVAVLYKDGERISENTYRISLSADESAGVYLIKAVAELDAIFTDNQNIVLPVVGSYKYTVTRTADPNVFTTFHDIDPNNAHIETAWSAYQKLDIIVTGVPSNTQTHKFKLELLIAPGVKDIQNYVDSDNVRNILADYVVRAPAMCAVELFARIRYENSIDLDSIKNKVVNYINSKSFISKLTVPEIINILFTAGVLNVDLTSLKLSGIVYDAAGTKYVLSGNNLDINTIADNSKLLSADTTVFIAMPSNINLEVEP